MSCRNENFFRGGDAGGFERWSISSHIRVQITSESVRLITLIGLNMFSTHNVSEKSSRKFLRTTFWRSVFKKWLKWPYSALSKGFSKVLCIKPKSSHLPLWWMWPSFSHISQRSLCSDLWKSLPFQDSLQRQVSKIWRNEGHIHQRGRCKLFSFMHKNVLKGIVSLQKGF